MPRKLLLVDESITIGRVVEMTFTGGDVQVIAVGDRREAMDRILQEQPDIVLADLGLDAPDGYELAAYIKGHPRLCHVPVLLLTGAFEPIDEPRAARCGCDGVLAKPFDVQAMHEAVTGLLDNPSGEDALPPGLEPAEQLAATASDTKPVEDGPFAPAVEGASVVASASAEAAAAFDTLKALFQKFIAVAEAQETAALGGCGARLEFDAARKEPAPSPACEVCPAVRPACDEATVDGWTELLPAEANTAEPPESAARSTPEDGDLARSLAGCVDGLSAVTHSDSMTEGGAPGCHADPAVVASALSLDDYFDLVDEFLARSRDAVASGGAPCEIPPFQLNPQR